jgi:hypothetical protein
VKVAETIIPIFDYADFSSRIDCHNTSGGMPFTSPTSKADGSTSPQGAASVYLGLGT